MIVTQYSIDLPQLAWWQWGKGLGLCLPILLYGLDVTHSLLWAFAAHCFIDFTAQSTHTAIGKAESNKGFLPCQASLWVAYPDYSYPLAFIS